MTRSQSWPLPKNPVSLFKKMWWPWPEASDWLLMVLLHSLLIKEVLLLIRKLWQRSRTTLERPRLQKWWFISFQISELVQWLCSTKFSETQAPSLLFLHSLWSINPLVIWSEMSHHYGCNISVIRWKPERGGRSPVLRGYHLGQTCVCWHSVLHELSIPAHCWPLDRSWPQFFATSAYAYGTSQHSLL